MFSNLLHKPNVRVANLQQVVGALKETNRKRVQNTITADGTAVKTFVAPWTGFVEELIIAGPAATSSSAGNSVTVQVLNVTQSNAVIASFDTYANLTELVANSGVKVRFQPAVSGGQALANFNEGDVLALKITVNGSVSGWTSGSIVQLGTAFTPNDKNYAF